MGSKETKLIEGIVKASKINGNTENIEKKIKKLWNCVDKLSTNLLEKEKAISFFMDIYEFLDSHHDVLQLFDGVSKEEIIARWFRYFDKNGDGKISYKEFREATYLIYNPLLISKRIKYLEESRKPEDSQHAICDGCLSIMLCGPADAGKTSLMNQFVDGTFNQEYIPYAQEGEKSKALILEDQKVLVKIYDTVGEERFRELTASYFRACSGAVIIFDITSQFSFEGVSLWLSSIELYAGEGTPKILIGNKSDLNEKREVSKELIQEFCAKNDLIYFEASAKTGDNVTEAFETLAITCARTLIPKDIPISTSKTNSFLSRLPFRGSNQTLPVIPQFESTESISPLSPRSPSILNKLQGRSPVADKNTQNLTGSLSHDIMPTGRRRNSNSSKGNSNITTSPRSCRSSAAVSPRSRGGSVTTSPRSSRGSILTISPRKKLGGIASLTLSTIGDENNENKENLASKNIDRSNFRSMTVSPRTQDREERQSRPRRSELSTKSNFETQNLTISCKLSSKGGEPASLGSLTRLHTTSAGPPSVRTGSTKHRSPNPLGRIPAPLTNRDTNI